MDKSKDTAGMSDAEEEEEMADDEEGKMDIKDEKGPVSEKTDEVKGVAGMSDDEEEEEEKEMADYEEGNMNVKEEKGPAVGAPSKGTNSIKDAHRARTAERRAQAAQQQLLLQQQGGDVQLQAQQLQNQSRFPSFGDNYEMLRDWTIGGLFADEAIDQREDDTCLSIVFTHLLQASHNDGKPIAQRRTLSYMDLANNVKKHTKRDGFAFRNLNLARHYIRDKGLFCEGKTSGRGLKIKGDFQYNAEANNATIYAQLDVGPLGIVVTRSNDLTNLEMGIFEVVSDGIEEDHALLVVAKGIKDGRIFLVAKNTWGPNYGNEGYIRIYLPDGQRYRIFWV